MLACLLAPFSWVSPTEPNRSLVSVSSADGQLNVVSGFCCCVLVSPLLACLAFLPRAAMLCSELWGSTGDHMDSKCAFRQRETLSHFTGAWLS